MNQETYVVADTRVGEDVVCLHNVQGSHAPKLNRKVTLKQDGTNAIAQSINELLSESVLVLCVGHCTLGINAEDLKPEIELLILLLTGAVAAEDSGLYTSQSKRLQQNLLDCCS